MIYLSYRYRNSKLVSYSTENARLQAVENSCTTEGPSVAQAVASLTGMAVKEHLARLSLVAHFSRGSPLVIIISLVVNCPARTHQESAGRIPNSSYPPALPCAVLSCMILYSCAVPPVHPGDPSRLSYPRARQGREVGAFAAANADAADHTMWHIFSSRHLHAHTTTITGFIPSHRRLSFNPTDHDE